MYSRPFESKASLSQRSVFGVAVAVSIKVRACLARSKARSSSVKCTAKNPYSTENLNIYIKHREPFRPFAPAVLAEAAADWFVRAAPSPAMLLVDPVRPERRAQIPAVTHADGTGRLQTVEKRDSPQFHALIAAFAARTGVPVLLNTSFNEHEPIVCTPADALRCFTKTGMDALCLGPFLLEWAASPDASPGGAAA